jgi:hypothetical protein
MIRRQVHDWNEPATRTAATLEGEERFEVFGLSICRVFYRAIQLNNGHDSNEAKVAIVVLPLSNQDGPQLPDHLAVDHDHGEHAGRADGQLPRQHRPERGAAADGRDDVSALSSRWARRTRRRFDITKARSSATSRPTDAGHLPRVRARQAGHLFARWGGRRNEFGHGVCRFR